MKQLNKYLDYLPPLLFIPVLIVGFMVVGIFSLIFVPIKYWPRQGGRPGPL